MAPFPPPPQKNRTLKRNASNKANEKKKNAVLPPGFETKMKGKKGKILQAGEESVVPICAKMQNKGKKKRPQPLLPVEKGKKGLLFLRKTRQKTRGKKKKGCCCALYSKSKRKRGVHATVAPERGAQKRVGKRVFRNSTVKKKKCKKKKKKKKRGTGTHLHAGGNNVFSIPLWGARRGGPFS